MIKFLNKTLLIFLSLVLFIVLITSYKAYDYCSKFTAEETAKLNEKGSDFQFIETTLEFHPSKNKNLKLFPLPIFPVFGKSEGKLIAITTTLKDIELAKIDLNQKIIKLNLYKHPKKEDIYSLSHPRENLNYLASLNYFDFVLIFLKSYINMIFF